MRPANIPDEGRLQNHFKSPLVRVDLEDAEYTGPTLVPFTIA